MLLVFYYDRRTKTARCGACLFIFSLSLSLCLSLSLSLSLFLSLFLFLFFSFRNSINHDAIRRALNPIIFVVFVTPALWPFLLLASFRSPASQVVVVVVVVAAVVVVVVGVVVAVVVVVVGGVVVVVVGGGGGFRSVSVVIGLILVILVFCCCCYARVSLSSVILNKMRATWRARHLARKMLVFTTQHRGTTKHCVYCQSNWFSVPWKAN